MQRLFKVPRVKKPKIQKIQIAKQTTTASYGIGSSNKNIEHWWDYLLSCTDDTKTDRNIIYWKYKYYFDTFIDNKDKYNIFKSPYNALQQKTRNVINRIYKNEFKRRKNKI